MRTTPRLTLWYERQAHYTKLYPADLRRWRRAVDGLRETADRAAARGVTLALHNYDAPLLRTGYEDALTMMREVDRPNMALCLDGTAVQGPPGRRLHPRGRARLRAAHPSDALRRVELQGIRGRRAHPGARPLPRRHDQLRAVLRRPAAGRLRRVSGCPSTACRA